MFCYDGLPFSWRIAAFIVALVITYWLQTHHRTLLRDCGRRVKKLSLSPIRAMVMIAFLSLSSNVLIAYICPPQPIVHDEFAYQLAADTYASGRLTNPTHPHWKHFETFHVLSKPTYMAKYPPGNSIALAIGQVATGHSIVGNWLTLAAALTALFWMLRAWVPSRWALIGCLLLSINAHMLMAWGQTWWGGSVQFFAGALLFGAMRRIVDSERWPWPVWWYATIYAIACVILANSRPFEGLVVCLISGTILLRWLWTQPVGKRLVRLKQLSIPVGLIGAVGIALLLVNNQAVTGDAFTMPYSAHSKQYQSSSTLIWSQPPPAKNYNLPHMERLHVGWSLARQQEAWTASGYLKQVQHKLTVLWRFFPIAGGIALVSLVFIRPQNTRWFWLAATCFFAIIAVELQFSFSHVFPHYIAPLACLFYALLAAGLRGWRFATRYSDVAKYVLPTLVVYSVICLLELGILKWKLGDKPSPRAVVEETLQDQRGKHLVFVKYPPDHDPHQEWVYNRADIDRAQTVWAHSLSAEEDRSLSHYFRDRQQWVIEVGKSAIQPFPLD